LAHTSEHYYRNDMGLTESERKEISGSVGDFNSKNKFRFSLSEILEGSYRRGLVKYLEAGEGPVSCRALEASCFIDPYWDLYPCSIFSEKIGNLKDRGFDLASLWKEKKCDEVREDIQHFRCPKCWSPCEAYTSILGDLYRGVTF